jgi:hypothetical protein
VIIYADFNRWDPMKMLLLVMESLIGLLLLRRGNNVSKKRPRTKNNE